MKQKTTLTVALFVLLSNSMYAQSGNNYIVSSGNNFAIILLAIVCLVPILFFIAKNFFAFKKQVQLHNNKEEDNLSITSFASQLSNKQVERLVKVKNKKCCGGCKNGGNCHSYKNAILLFFVTLISSNLFAQDTQSQQKNMMSQPGILITITLIAIPVLLGVWYAIAKAVNAAKVANNDSKIKIAEKLATEISNVDDESFNETFQQKSKASNYNLANNELAGNEQPNDAIGIVQNISSKHETHFTALKKKSAKRPALDSDITKLILWYIGCSAFWLLIGTGIGEYVGIKFVAPDADHISWLSFGRLRPVHTNIVFWGWASLGMIGLGLYVVPTVSNTKLYSIKWGWISLVLTNLMVIFGTICLMSGFNNGGGEFREYVWPVMALFAVALILTLLNFILTVAKRTTKEIYISNWYIISAIIFTIIVALTAYLPFWQDGVSETIVQGYFMHSGVGMWFTLFTLGLLYYFIPQQINKPIYAYSLGILAFWTQIIFYTVIGTHHFTFAPIPWWLQTVGIVGSAGMIIPVTAATINFVMTFKGQWSKVSKSYTLPFFFVAVIYYFVVSMQGTAEAFKYTNLLWHFTDFTVAHAHLGFYGIITFGLWGGMYAIIPRLTGKEPPQYLVGAHFWLAFVGLLFYTIPLSIGATLRGSMWMEGKPFIDSVVMMFDWWLWRAIGGSLMFISHIVFFYNFYKMTAKQIEEVDVKEETLKILEAKNKTNH